jgi:hypothetical protein
MRRQGARRLGAGAAAGVAAATRRRHWIAVCRFTGRVPEATGFVALAHAAGPGSTAETTGATPSCGGALALAARSSDGAFCVTLGV